MVSKILVSQFVTVVCMCPALVWSAAQPAQSMANIGCTMLASRTIEIRSPVAGLLESVPYGRGQVVRKGNVVAKLDSDVERSAVAIAQQRASMVGAIDSGKARVELLGRKFDRRRALASEMALSLQERDDADLERRLAEAELKQAHESLALARDELRQAQEQLNRRILRSPIDGIVVEQYVQAGELVNPSDERRPILKLIQYNPLRVEVLAPLIYFGRVKAGDKLIILPEQPVGGRIVATVMLVDQMIDPSSGMFGIRLEIPNPQLKIPPGLACKIAWAGDMR